MTIWRSGAAVTNLTGTQSDRLNLPEWVLRLFTTGMTTGNFQEDGLFTPYVRDVQVRSTVYCTQPGGTVPHALSGITGLAADSALPAGLRLHHPLAGGLRRLGVPGQGLFPAAAGGAGRLGG